MSTEQKVLFGVDNSQFARDAVAAAGGLLKNNENLDSKTILSTLLAKDRLKKSLR